MAPYIFTHIFCKLKEEYPTSSDLIVQKKYYFDL
jgi:hypothetical protein